MIAELLALSILGLTPTIDVVYPRAAPGDPIPRIAEVDSNFVFGSVNPPDAELLIDGMQVMPHANGSFLAWLPVNWLDKAYRMTAIHAGDTTTFPAPFDVLPPEVPAVPPNETFPINVLIDGGVARTHPKGAYYLFPETGVRAVAESWSDGYWQIPISAGRSVWIEDRFVEPLGDSIVIENPVIWRVDVRAASYWVDVVVPVGRRLFYRVVPSSSERSLNVLLFGAVSHVDRISYEPGSDLIHEVRWDQPTDGVVRLEILTATEVWGYQPWWWKGRFILSVKKPPNLRRGMRAIHVAIDAGHGGSQLGAIGPKRLLEKDVNLRIARAVANELRERNVRVTMTRRGDTYVGLNRRIEIAREAQCDLLLSIHHNALPDGTNPFGNYGIGVRYYQPQSREIARAIQDELAVALDIPNEGVSYHNLALTRPTAMQAVLLEIAYMMIPEQEEMMRKPGYAELVAKTIVRGIESFVHDRNVAN